MQPAEKHHFRSNMRFVNRKQSHEIIEIETGKSKWTKLRNTGKWVKEQVQSSNAFVIYFARFSNRITFRTILFG